MIIINGLLAVLLALIARAMFVYLSPYKTCPWCKHKEPGRPCWRCGGHREVRRPGAAHIRRARLAARSVLRDWRENR
jgi:hypothetical protein